MRNENGCDKLNTECRKTVGVCEEQYTGNSKGSDKKKENEDNRRMDH